MMSQLYSQFCVSPALRAIQEERKMAKKKVTVKTFEDECTVIDLRTEYGCSFVGEAPIAIVSKLGADQIKKEFPKEIEAYPYFTVITPEIFEAFQDFHKENEQHRINGINHPAIPYELAESVLIDPLGNIPIICESGIALESIIEKMLNLPDRQGSRLYKRYILGYTTQEIAVQEGVSEETVRRSLRDGKTAILGVFIDLEVAA